MAVLSEVLGWVTAAAIVLAFLVPLLVLLALSPVVVLVLRFLML